MILNQISFGKSSLFISTIGLILIIFAIWGGGLLPKAFRSMLEILPILSLACASIGIVTAGAEIFSRGKDRPLAIIGASLSGLTFGFNFILLAIALFIVMVLVAYFVSA